MFLGFGRRTFRLLEGLTRDGTLGIKCTDIYREGTL